MEHPSADFDGRGNGKVGERMNRKEAIETLEESKRQNEIMRDNPNTFWKSADIQAGVEHTKRRIEALEFAIETIKKYT